MTISSKRRPGDVKTAHGVRGRSAAAIAAFVVAPAFLPALAAVPESFNAMLGKPRLANLEIEIWPEYDRPAALVFLKGEVASGAGQSISLRLPASSGGPSAVAQSSAAGGKLLDLPYQRTDAKDFITLRIQPPDRFFHIEFYDKLDTVKEKREYRYVWPGDLAVDHLSVHVQQPAGVTGFAITPELADSVAGNDTLIYWTKDMGAAPAGKALPITIRYTKDDARTSKELLGPRASAVADAPASPPPVSSPPPAADSVAPASVNPFVYWIPAAIIALLGALAGGIVWRRRRLSVTAAGATGFCTKCGNSLRADDRYCSKCGEAVDRQPTL